MTGNSPGSTADHIGAWAAPTAIRSTTVRVPPTTELDSTVTVGGSSVPGACSPSECSVTVPLPSTTTAYAPFISDVLKPTPNQLPPAAAARVATTDLLAESSCSATATPPTVAAPAIAPSPPLLAHSAVAEASALKVAVHRPDTETAAVQPYGAEAMLSLPTVATTPSVLIAAWHSASVVIVSPHRGMLPSMYASNTLGRRDVQGHSRIPL
mmetsp:Transcript_26154/g.68666  ORF Transcript_26154/g.68666 Transcript_26154/m.68666 type:complete len:211 (-) Transcript_26154:903-1535(-)